MSWIAYAECTILLAGLFMPTVVHSQQTPNSDNVCVYSFTVPNWTPSSSSTGVKCGADKGLAELRQLMVEQQTTVKLLQQQNAALLTDQSSARQEIASSRQEIAVLLTEQTSSKQQIASLMTQMAALTQLFSAGVLTTKNPTADGPPAVDNNCGNASPTSSPGGGGVTYIRWGRTVCPNRAQVLYKGSAAGSHYQHSGSGSNYLCLPDTPEWGNKILSTTGAGTFIYGVEYEHMYVNNEPFSWENNGDLTLIDHNAPCVVCHVPTRSAHVMIPARRNCTEGWMKEYEGYIVSEYQAHARSEFVCLDSAPEVVARGGANSNGALFYAVRGSCGSLPCPKYVEDWVLSCVVCTK